MSYIGQGLPADVFSGYVTDTFTGDGSATTFTLSKAPFSADSLIVVIDNVIQQPTTNFTVSGTTLTIVGTAILSGIKGYAIHTGGVIPTTQASNLTSSILTSQTDIGGSLADADLFLVDDGAGGTLRKTAASRLKTYIGSVGGDTGLDLNDNVKIRLGTGNDTELYFTGTDSIIDHTSGSGGLYIRSDAILLQDSQSTPNTYFRIDQGAQAKAVIPTHNTYAFKVQHAGDPASAAPYGLEIEYSNGAPDPESDTANLFIKASDTGAVRFKVGGDGDVMNHDNSYGAISDERLKTNIVDANSQWDDIKALKIRNYEKKDDVELHGAGKKVQIGVIAQELETAGMTGLTKDGEPNAFDIKHGVPAEGKVKSVKYSVLYMKAIKALQEAMAKIETLETKVKALEDA
jgi:hypothetical protein